MTTTTSVAVVHAIADVMDPGVSDTPKVWATHGAPSTPFEGLYGMGDTFAAARKQLAANVWLALSTGALELDVPTGQIAAVRVLATTRKTFPVGALGDEA